jgi:hypothetical protein
MANDWGWSLGPERNAGSYYGGATPDTSMGQDMFGQGRYLTDVGVTPPDPPPPGAGGMQRGGTRPQEPGGPPAPPAAPATLGLEEGWYDRQNKKWYGRNKDGWNAADGTALSGDLDWFMSNMGDGLKKQKPGEYWRRYQDEQDTLWTNEQGQMAANSGRRSMMGSPVYRRTAFGW